MARYRAASEYDPSNRGIATKVAAIEKTLRDRLEASRPTPPGQQLRDRVRAASAEPILNPTIDRLNLTFTNTGFKDVLNFIANASGINVTYDREVVDRPMSIQINDVTVEQALNQIMAMNQLSYKIVNPTSIFVFQDLANKHQQYDEQVIRTFFIQHADVTELGQILSAIIRLPNIAVQPVISFNKTNNTMTIRASTTVMQILEKVIEANDKPRAELVFDIEILEVDRDRAKTYGLNLSEFALGAVFSPEVSPGATTTAATTGTGTGTTTTTTGRSTSPSAVVSPPPFNLNTISRGVSTADFYLAVPTAVVRALESDTHSRLLAKPQLRGAEGAKLTLNLGTQVPIVTTSYTPIATGGAGVNPLNSFNLKDVGINIDITPRVTLDGDILLDLNVESNAQGPDKNVAGANYPSFTRRAVSTRLRLRDGESNLLAGLLREDEATTVNGLPGAIHVPGLKQVLSNNTSSKSQIDLIMLLTPHIVRTSEITESDLRPIYIGSQQSLGLGGPPPLIAPPEQPAAPAAPAPAAPPPQTQPGAVLVPPPGTTPVPGFIAVPPPPAPPAPAPPQAPEAVSPPAVPPQAGAVPPPGTPPAAAVQPAPADQAVTQGVGAAQVLISLPATTFRVGQGPVHRPPDDRERLAVDRPGPDAHLRSDGAAGAERSGRQLHAIGRRDRDLHPAAGARTRGPHGGAHLRRDRGDRHRSRRGHPVRCHCAGDGHPDAQRHRYRPGGHGDGAAVQTGHGKRPAMTLTEIRRWRGSERRDRAAGYTFVELLVVSTIVLILASAVMPLARVSATRQREVELRRALREIRTGIDQYKDAADQMAISPLEIKVGSENYPPDLETLVQGVTRTNDASGVKLKFLRRVPVDPMTHSMEWGMRSYQDPPDSTRWGGQNVFDVHTTYDGIALDGTRYRDW